MQCMANIVFKCRSLAWMVGSNVLSCPSPPKPYPKLRAKPRYLHPNTLGLMGRPLPTLSGDDQVHPNLLSTRNGPRHFANAKTCHPTASIFSLARVKTQSEGALAQPAMLRGALDPAPYRGGSVSCGGWPICRTSWPLAPLR